MKKLFKKSVAILLCIMMIVSVTSVGAFASDKKTDCGADCEYYPTIIIPGLGQSGTYVADENGDYIRDEDGKKISSFPAYIQIPQLIKKLLAPALLTLATQRDIGFSDAVADALDSCFSINACDLNGQTTGNIILDRYMYSYAECNEEEQAKINSHIPFNLYPTELPKDHLYYFTYNSFANHIDVVEDLNNYIKMVMEQTGHDIVNLVPISQGGTIASALFEYHPEVMDTIHKILFIVPALDGSTIIGDIFNDRINFLNKDYLYNGFLENLGLLDENTARIVEVALRILPDEILMDALNKAVDKLLNNVLLKSTSMWTLCPSADYPSAAAKHLSTPEMASIKAQTDKYYQAQLNCKDNIKTLLAKGVQIFSVVEYDFALINVGETWNTQNADYIIHLDSTSMGATSAKVGETLPADYVQQNTYCKNPNHNHISPDRVVDVSTSLLPDTSFYFDGQRHDLTAHNDVILKIAMELIASDEIKDVYSSPDFPQFNIGRDVRVLRNLLASAEAVDASKLSAEKKAELDAAVEQAKGILNDTTVEKDEFKNAEDELSAVLASIGAIEVEEEKEPSGFFEKLSLWLYDNYGTDGYSEMPRATLKKLGNAIKSFFSGIFN